jgi:hypothetical protein
VPEEVFDIGVGDADVVAGVHGAEEEASTV